MSFGNSGPGKGERDHFRSAILRSAISNMMHDKTRYPLEMRSKRYIIAVHWANALWSSLNLHGLPSTACRLTSHQCETRTIAGSMFQSFACRVNLWPEMTLNNQTGTGIKNTENAYRTEESSSTIRSNPFKQR